MLCRTCLRARALGLATRAEFQTASQIPSRSQIATQSRSTSQTARSFYHNLSVSSVPRRPSASLRTLRPYSTAPDADPTPSSSPPALEKPAFDTEAEGAVWDRLAAELAPTELWVQDISGGCGSMYGIEIASEKFRGLNMLKQQRLVNAALGDMVKQWHGVQIKTRVP